MKQEMREGKHTEWKEEKRSNGTMPKRQGEEKGYGESLGITQIKAKIRQRSKRQEFCKRETEHEENAKKKQGKW